MPRTKSNTSKHSTANLGFESKIWPASDTTTRVSAKPQPQSNLAGLLRSERHLLANPPFIDSNTVLRDSALHKREAKLQVVSEAKDNFRTDEDVRWQWSGAIWITERCPESERRGVHQFGVPPKPARCDSANRSPDGMPQFVSEARDNNAIFAWVQQFIHHPSPFTFTTISGADE
jgi:hypothetical protein